MKLPEVRRYANEIIGLVKQCDMAQAAISEITALMRAANGAGDRNQQLQLERQRAQIAKQLEAIEKEVIVSTRARDFEGARQLQIDISLRIEEAMKAYVDWRKMVQEYEFTMANEGFAPEPEDGKPPVGFTRTMAAIELEKVKVYAEQRVEFAAKAVPERTVVLL